MTDNVIHIRFYEELNDFLPKDIKKKAFTHHFKGNPSVKDVIESIGVPHVEVDLILVNGKSVDFNYLVNAHDSISVYPVFERFDISNVTRLRNMPLRDPKFILDVHLGKLVKYLRFLGFDTYYENDLADDYIIDISIKDNRIILTRDLGILKNSKVTHGYWIRSQQPNEQLNEVIKTFDLGKWFRPFTRCSFCNGKVTAIDKKDIIHRLKPLTKEYYSEFYRCASCDKIYWEGSHFEKIKESISKIIEYS